MKFKISCEPKIINEITGNNVVIDVIIHLVNTLDKLSLTTSFKSFTLVTFLRPLLFIVSRILSKTTIVSFIEYPIIDKIAAINTEDISNCNKLNTKITNKLSCNKAIIVPTAFENLNLIAI